MKYKALSIAGFDGSGGAGIQADLKVFSAFGCYGMTVLTALPVQNTVGVKKCYPLPLESIEEQLAAIFEDITPDVVKIGMLFSSEVAELVSESILKYTIKAPIVVDPVMVAKSGDHLLFPEAVKSIQEKIIPISTVVTPNLSEAKELTGIEVRTKEEMLTVAKELLKFGSKSVLLKGGHLKDSNESCDLLVTADDDYEWFSYPRIETKNTHGTGCTLSAAIASCLALGLDLFDSCRAAKKYISKALEAAQDQHIGKGIGPVHHFYHLWPTLSKIIEEQND
ncbi:bifunctional hydroxymethylpyrimidine kinase/phosphomethylpyrimidine kinase [Wolbachia endosymbiont of Cimex lectularius]|uniref:bifunctional hydroxymethylpyrimidine kinase/phosphomethylpyrimidine kinase n=1 Tax=Wolbachia endosymbiont of Cimex lectularius TaxID=246273 RepID=UPI000499B7EF|nr:bifunctional hydroxymethylpyrimidine kinase/phosphomethylpyrimidine kinase [Wolbachia endosymbiont of Cimex lectularius]BAO99581.1 phosphomethylpyrimidine kinase [Wolbachia endosymbiont of Cimex lectularius]